MSNVVNAENAFGQNAQPELKKVIVYEAEVVQEVLDTLNRRTPVVGIDAMRQIVNVFDTLNTKGSLQEAGYAGDGGYVDPSYVNPVEEVNEYPEPPRFVEETGVAYDAAVEEIVSETEEYNEDEDTDDVEVDNEDEVE